MAKETKTRTRAAGSAAKKGSTKEGKGDLVFADGLSIFSPHPSAPRFVKGRMIITLDDFFAWVEGEGKQYVRHSDKYGDQLVFDIKSRKEDDELLYASVDTYKAGE